MKLSANFKWKFRTLLTQMFWMVIIWVVALNFFVFLRFANNPNSANPIDQNAPVDYLAIVLDIVYIACSY